jgi:hypothetical protein
MKNTPLELVHFGLKTYNLPLSVIKGDKAIGNDELL